MRLSNMNFKLICLICSRKETTILVILVDSWELLKKITTQKVLELSNAIIVIKYSEDGFRNILELRENY